MAVAAPRSSRLLALENTWAGRVLPRDYIRAPATWRAHGLGFHLDGARLYNAAVAEGIEPREITRHFDSVSVCFSKGLGAPIGSMLLGSSLLIDRARRWRKVVGGGWRQASVLAAMANHALDHHVQRLADDHRRASELAQGLRGVRGVAVEGPHTNMVFITVPAESVPALDAHLRARHIRLAISKPEVRLVTHLDIDDDGVRTHRSPPSLSSSPRRRALVVPPPASHGCAAAPRAAARGRGRR